MYTSDNEALFGTHTILEYVPVAKLVSLRSPIPGQSANTPTQTPAKTMQTTEGG